MFLALTQQPYYGKEFEVDWCLSGQGGFNNLKEGVG